MIKWLKEITDNPKEGVHYKKDNWGVTNYKIDGHGVCMCSNLLSSINGYFSMSVEIRAEYNNDDIYNALSRKKNLTGIGTWHRNIFIENVSELYTFKEGNEIIYSIALIPDVLPLNLLDVDGNIKDSVDVGYANKDIIIKSVMAELGKNNDYMEFFNEWLINLGKFINNAVKKIRYEYD